MKSINLILVLVILTIASLAQAQVNVELGDINYDYVGYLSKPYKNPYQYYMEYCGDVTPKWDRGGVYTFFIITKDNEWIQYYIDDMVLYLQVKEQYDLRRNIWYTE